MENFLTIILSAAPDVRNKTLSLQGKQDSTPLSDLYDPSLENQKMKHRTSKNTQENSRELPSTRRKQTKRTTGTKTKINRTKLTRNIDTLRYHVLKIQPR